MIGIVGGIGPYAGKDLLEKVFNNTVAKNDQEHLDVALLSISSKIRDRTEYLIGKVDENPGYAIAQIILELEKIGVTVAGLPCNTAHAKAIFSTVLKELKIKNSKVRLLNMITETIDFIKVKYPQIKKVGVLSTTGTYKNKLYENALEQKKLEAILPTIDMQQKLVHPAIYHPKYGIKAVSKPIHPKALENLSESTNFLLNKGAEAIILGCTEIPLAFNELTLDNLTTIDPTDILARALIKVYAPDKLRIV